MEAETEKAIALGVLGGAAFLLADIRFEHREVLGETWAAWIPLTYAVLLLVAGGAAIIRFDRGGRGVLRILFAAAVAVGALGIWFHSAGHPFRSVAQVLSSFALTPGKNGGIKIGSEPPPLAPAAFCGLGFIGVIACGRSRRRPLRVAAGSLPAPSLASGSGLERRADSPP
ncbi:MAG: hypothetical protein ACJ79U_20170 [Myxococcales bacterium]